MKIYAHSAEGCKDKEWAAVLDKVLPSGGDSRALR